VHEALIEEGTALNRRGEKAGKEKDIHHAMRGGSQGKGTPIKGEKKNSMTSEV